jgi:hypothetical protein
MAYEIGLGSERRCTIKEIARAARLEHPSEKVQTFRGHPQGG